MRRGAVRAALRPAPGSRRPRRRPASVVELVALAVPVALAVTAAMAVIVVIVQVVQFFGNWLARRILRR